MTTVIDPIKFLGLNRQDLYQAIARVNDVFLLPLVGAEIPQHTETKVRILLVRRRYRFAGDGALGNNPAGAVGQRRGVTETPTELVDAGAGAGAEAGAGAGAGSRVAPNNCTKVQRVYNSRGQLIGKNFCMLKFT